MLTYTGNRSDFTIAVAITNKLIEYGLVEFWITEKGEFTHTNLTGEQIALLIHTYKGVGTCEVKAHRFWRFSRAVADFSGNRIRINTRHKRSVASLVGTCCHEWLHYIDKVIQHNTQVGNYFNHGSNSPTGKQDSVQYAIGKKAKHYIIERSHEHPDAHSVYEALLCEFGC